MRNFNNYKRHVLKLIVSNQSVLNMISVIDLYEKIAKESDFQIVINNDHRKINILSDKKDAALPISEVGTPSSLDINMYKLFIKGTLTTAASSIPPV